MLRSVLRILNKHSLFKRHICSISLCQVTANHFSFVEQFIQRQKRWYKTEWRNTTNQRWELISFRIVRQNAPRANPQTTAFPLEMIGICHKISTFYRVTRHFGLNLWGKPLVSNWVCRIASLPYMWTSSNSALENQSVYCVVGKHWLGTRGVVPFWSPFDVEQTQNSCLDGSEQLQLQHTSWEDRPHMHTLKNTLSGRPRLPERNKYEIKK